MRSLIFVIAVAAVSAHGQSLERSVIGSAGRTFVGGGIALSATVGQIANAVRPAPSLILEQGFQPTTGYEIWSAGHPGLGGADDDPDQDGRCNALEYALGSDPFHRDPHAAIQVTVPAGGIPGVTVAKGDPAGKDGQVVYRIEMSTTLVPGSWSTMGLMTGADTQSLLVVTVNSPPGRAFFRLRVFLNAVTP